MKRSAAAAVAAGLGLALGCTGWPPPRFPTAETLRPQAQEEETASLRRGRALALTSCASCHRPFGPESRPAEAWPGILRDMGRRASLSFRQTADLERYMAAAARGAPPPAP